MRDSFDAFVAVALAAVVIVCVCLLVPYAPSSPIAGATVEVMTPGGHGSGVAIGGGYILTAGHVAGDEHAVTLKLDNGQTVDAAVLWANHDYDVALLHTTATTRTAPLDCHGTANGAAVTLRGNPLDLEFITTRGHVAGTARKYGPWASVLVLDAQIIPGMSGGPVFDVDGNVVAIAVGVMLEPAGLVAAPVGISYAVPASVVCLLMART